MIRSLALAVILLGAACSAQAKTPSSTPPAMDAVSCPAPDTQPSGTENGQPTIGPLLMVNPYTGEVKYVPLRCRYV